MFRRKKHRENEGPPNKDDGGNRPASSSKAEPVEQLRSLEEQIGELQRERFDSAPAMQWRLNVTTALRRLFEDDSVHLSSFNNLRWRASGPLYINPMRHLGADPQRVIEEHHQEVFLRSLEAARGVLRSAREAAGDDVASSRERAWQIGADAKVIVVGATGFSGVACVEWDDPEFPNLGDYDVVVLGTRALGDVAMRASEDDALFDRVRSNVDSAAIAVARLLINDGTVIALLSEEMQARRRSTNSLLGGFFSNYSWCSLPIRIDAERGESLKIVDAAWSEYLGGLSGWSVAVALDTEKVRQQWFRKQFAPDYVSWEVSAIVESRTKHLIAATFRYAVHPRVSREMVASEPSMRSGRLVLVPALDLGEVQSISSLLDTVLGMPQGVQLPKWLEVYPVHGVEAIRSSQEESRAVIRGIEEEIARCERQIEHENELWLLLYGTGKPLEDVCSRALRELGALIHPPIVSEEEFVVEFDGQRGLAEVKGNSKSIKLGDLRQLGDYQSNPAAREHGISKALFFGNAWRETEPSKRTDRVFPTNVVEYAEARSIALIDTVDLFHALMDVRQGKVTGREVLAEIFAATGECRLTRS